MYLPSSTLALHAAVGRRLSRQCDHQNRNAQKKTVVRIIPNTELVKSELVRLYFGIRWTIIQVTQHCRSSGIEETVIVGFYIHRLSENVLWLYN
jgi:hypothetical protein